MKFDKLGEHFQIMHHGTEAEDYKETPKSKKSRFDSQGTLSNLGYVPTSRFLLIAPSTIPIR